MGCISYVGGCILLRLGVINPYVRGGISYVWELLILTFVAFGGSKSLRLGVRNPYVRGLYFLRLGLINCYVRGLYRRANEVKILVGRHFNHECCLSKEHPKILVWDTFL